MKNKGQNLVEFLVVIAAVSITSILAYTLLGGNIHEMFSSSHTQVKKFDPFGTGGTAEHPETVTPSATTGTTTPSTPASMDNPIKDCTDGMCSIDYGSLVMTGIPEDFSEFIETSGPAAGSDTINSILDSLIKLAENGEIDVDLAALKVLSNKGHALADGEKEVETFLCESLSYGALLETYELGKSNQISTNEYAEFMDALDSFKNSTVSMDPNVKSLVADLGNEIDVIFKDFDENFETIVLAQEEEGIFSPDEYSNVLKPKPSVTTDLDSKVICNVGNYADEGHECD